MLAVVKAIEHFHSYLYGRKFLTSRRPCLLKSCKFCQRREDKELAVTSKGRLLQITAPDKRLDDIANFDLEIEQSVDADLKVVKPWLEEGLRPDWQEIAGCNHIIKGYWLQWDSLRLR